MAIFYKLCVIILMNEFLKIRIPHLYSSYLLVLILKNIKFRVSLLNNTEINIGKVIFNSVLNIKDR